MAIIRVKDITDVNLPAKPKMHGGNGDVYEYLPSLYFKRLRSHQGDLSSEQNRERLEILEKLMNLQGTKYLILPEDIYMTDDCLLGYTSEVNKAKQLWNISLKTRYDDVIKCFKLIQGDIRILADNSIFNFDTSVNNLLFDNKLYFLDFDNSVYSEDRVFERTMFGIFWSVYLSVIKDGFGSSVLMERDLENLLEQYKNYTSVAYDLFFKALRRKLEYDTNIKIKTVGDVRRALSVTKRNFHGYY